MNLVRNLIIGSAFLLIFVEHIILVTSDIRSYFHNDQGCEPSFIFFLTAGTTRVQLGTNMLKQTIDFGRY
jgi:hypothetical protein